MAVTENVAETTFNVKIMLQINKKLFEKGIISREIYEMAVSRIVSRPPGD